MTVISTNRYNRNNIVSDADCPDTNGVKSNGLENNGLTEVIDSISQPSVTMTTSTEGDEEEEESRETQMLWKNALIRIRSQIQNTYRRVSFAKE